MIFKIIFFDLFFKIGKSKMINFETPFWNEETTTSDGRVISVRMYNVNGDPNKITTYNTFLHNVLTKLGSRVISYEKAEEFMNGSRCCIIRLDGNGYINLNRGTL
jgi:hypothetical protein